MGIGYPVEFADHKCVEDPYNYTNCSQENFHYNQGCIPREPTPVEQTTWSAVKAMYE
jgi:hypothetical protein